MSAFKKKSHGGQGSQGRVVVWGVLGWLCLLNVSAWGQFSGGSGTGVDPYLISDANELQAIGLDSSHWDKHFQLTADLDLTGAAMTPIGNLATNFTGTFDGGDFVLTNLNINLPATDYVGLFGIVDNAVDPNTIFNLRLIDPDITGGNRVGGLAGYLKNGTLTGCTANGGSVNGNQTVGGLVGLNNGGTINDCHAGGLVNSNAFVGGLVGWNNVGTISDSSVSGQVHGTNSVGGLVGLNNGTVSHCSSTGSVDGIFYVGGLAGYNLGGMIRECYATGPVTGTNSRVGGLAGVNDNGTISNCYATGASNGFGHVGGLVGRNYKATINHCYATGAVSGNTDVGGLVGIKVAGTVSHSFWDTDTSGQVSSAGGTGKTTVAMQTASTFACWWVDSGLWTLDEGVEPPRLVWEGAAGDPISLATYAGGSGTSNDPYLIADVNDLLDLSLTMCAWDQHFRLIFDPDMDGIFFTPIGTVGTPFTGTFDGNGHTISNLTIDLPTIDYVGLFGNVDYTADPNANTIFDVGLIDPNTNGSGDVGGLVGRLENGTLFGCTVVGGSVTGDENVGSLVGRNGGTISKSYASGKVNGTHTVGGLVGWNAVLGAILNCYASGPVSGAGDTVGGLVGRNRGTISECTATGRVNGTHTVGGLVGWNAVLGSILNCYASGPVSGAGDTVGGLVGENRGMISDCYATGPVTGTGLRVGGLIGNNFWQVSRCYATGQVMGTGSLIGGLLGENDGGTISSSFWDKETGDPNTMCGSEINGGTGCDNNHGKTTVLMQDPNTFISAGWDFAGESANGTEDIWRMCVEGVDYPRLRWEYVRIGDFGCPDGVGMADYVLFSNWWGATHCTVANNWCEGADFDRSGVVDWADALEFFGNWLSGI